MPILRNTINVSVKLEEHKLITFNAVYKERVELIYRTFIGTLLFFQLNLIYQFLNKF